MRPADDIKKLIDESRITSSRQVDRRILADALEDLGKRRVDRVAVRRPGVWRIAMNTKTGKLAAAAVVAIAVLVVVHFLGNPLSPTLTFAQVIQPILRANTAVLDIIIGTEGEGTPVIHDMIMGSRIRRTLSNVPQNVSVIDLQTSRILSLDESKKEAVFVDLKGLPPIPNYLDHLKNVLVKLQDSPHFVTEDLGVRQIDGREAVGFHSTNPKIEITLWADTKTGLPIRIDQKEGQLNVICKNLQFDVPLEETLFSMEVPDGYTSQGQTQIDLMGATEEDFIEGLRIRAEIFRNSYFPDGVGVDDFMRSIETMQGKGEELGLSAEQEAELGMKLNKHLLFIRFYKGQGKWYYRGKGVKLGDADTAIFWYRPKGSETYRVIYGDLRVEDVARENLPEPLDADDGVEPSVVYQSWSKPDFVGRQEDLWRIGAAGQVTVQSDLTLMKGPQDASVMPITLPYATGVLTSATIDDAPVRFEPAGPGKYKLHLPLDKLEAGQTRITCQWTLVLANLEQASHNVPLKSLIPVVSYRLAVALDPDSGWEYVQDPSQSSWVPFSIGNPSKPGADFGVCGLGLRKRQ
ncbi:MAG: hypothetical protein JW955_14725 [Sedimentisphaerales bacterium]|nr:hypothetical protein [Sedimentisphaerales bacterium]